MEVFSGPGYMWCLDIIYKNLIHSPRTNIMLITLSTNIQYLNFFKMLNGFNFVIIKGEGYRTIPANSQPFWTSEVEENNRLHVACIMYLLNFAHFFMSEIGMSDETKINTLTDLRSKRKIFNISCFTKFSIKSTKIFPWIY